MTALMTPILIAGFDLPLTLAVIAGVITLHFLYLTLRPLFEEGDISAKDWARMEDESTVLLHRRDRVIAELRDLEFEAAMNKVGEADLNQLRHRYETEALNLIEELDAQASLYKDQIQAEVEATLKAADERRAKRRAEERAEKHAEKPAEELAEEPAEELAEKPAEDPAEEPAEDPAEELAEESTEEPAEEPTEELINVKTKSEEGS